MSTALIESAVMAKQAKPKEAMRQLNVAIRATTYKRMMKFGNDHPLQPSLAKIAEAAIAQYLDAEEPKLRAK